MREITSHKVNGLNEAITITAVDGPGPGGASHRYDVNIIDPRLWDKQPDGSEVLDIEKTATQRHGVQIVFQNGPIAEAGANGLSNEALLAIVEDRLKGFQSGQFACRENAIALTKIQEAMH